MQTKDDYLNSLPKKRCGSGAIILNEEGKIMMLKTTYSDFYEIPGGVVEQNESPIECCKREIFEEIGLDLKIEKLLVLEYQKQEFDDSFMFLFDGGTLTNTQIQNIKLQEKEIECFGFYSLEEIKELTVEILYNRVKKAVQSLYEKEIIYLESK